MAAAAGQALCTRYFHTVGFVILLGRLVPWPFSLRWFPSPAPVENRPTRHVRNGLAGRADVVADPIIAGVLTVRCFLIPLRHFRIPTRQRIFGAGPGTDMQPWCHWPVTRESCAMVGLSSVFWVGGDCIDARRGLAFGLIAMGYARWMQGWVLAGLTAARLFASRLSSSTPDFLDQRSDPRGVSGLRRCSHLMVAGWKPDRCIRTAGGSGSVGRAQESTGPCSGAALRRLLALVLIFFALTIAGEARPGVDPVN